MTNSTQDIKSWDERLKDQAERHWDNYSHVRIDLTTARLDEPLLVVGEFIYVEDASDNDTAVAKIKLQKNNNDALDLEQGVEIHSVYTQVYITNEALEDEWLDLVFGINFEYYKNQVTAAGGGGLTGTAQQVLNLTHANPNTNVAAASNACERALIKADVQNTGISWIDFGVAAVQNSCVPLDPGEWIRVLIADTDEINANFEVGGEVVYIVYEA